MEILDAIKRLHSNLNEKQLALIKIITDDEFTRGGISQTCRENAELEQRGLTTKQVCSIEVTLYKLYRRMDKMRKFDKI